MRGGLHPHPALSRREGVLPLLLAIVVCLPLGGCWSTPIATSVGGSDAAEESLITTKHRFVSEKSSPAEFHEAPMLADRVKAGKLPAVKDRVSAEPLVIVPLERAGKYGGTWRRAFTGTGDMQNIDRIQHDHLIYFDLDGRTLVPHIAKSWEVSDDGRVFTFHLRPGMKWSDGKPFTADDFMFAYEDVMMNDELCPSKPTWLKTKSGMGKMEKVDDTTIRFVFLDPNYVFPEACAGLAVAGQWGRSHFNSAMFLPRHYLQQFHAKFAAKDGLEKQAKGEGFDNWVAYFRDRAQPHRNREVPTVGPWVTVQPINQEQFILDRNPYYWAVDSEGNQLPYVDRIVMRMAGDAEVLNLRAIMGEIDMQHRHIQLSKVPVLHDNAERGDYRILLWPDWGGNDCCVYFNQNYDGDAEIASLLKSLNFRKALSLGIDREEINQLVFLGAGVPRAFLPPAETPYYPGEKFELASASLDRDEANKLLDELGLDKRDSAGIRLRRDNGRRLSIGLEVQSATMLDYRAVAELLERHWAQIGVAVQVMVEDSTLFTERSYGNQMQLTLWNPGGCENLWTYPFSVIPYFTSTLWAPATGDWHTSGGKSGQPPTPTMQRLLDLFEKGSTLPLEERIALGQEIWRIHAENLFVVGTVGLSPAVNGVVVVKNHFRNVPDVAPNTPTVQNPGIARPETFFFDE
jgi:peptide/nickel transport system substrate-binding protein